MQVLARRVWHEATIPGFIPLATAEISTMVAPFPFSGRSNAHLEHRWTYISDVPPAP